MAALLADLEAKLENAATPVERINALNALGMELMEGEPKRAVQLAGEAQQLCHLGEFAAAPYKRGLAESLLVQARCAHLGGEHDRALICALEALPLADEIQHDEILPRLLHTIGASYGLLGEAGIALEYYARLRQMCEESGDRMELARTLVGIANTYSYSNDHARAYALYQESLPILQEVGLESGVILTLNNLCYTAYKMGRIQESLVYGQQGLVLCREKNLIPPKIALCNSLAAIYLDQDQPQPALTLIERALALQAREQQPELQVESLLVMSRIQGHLGQRERALDFARQALALAEKDRYRRYIYEAHQQLADLYQQESDFGQALEHYRAFSMIKETVFSEESALKMKNREALLRTRAARKEAEYFAHLYEVAQQYNQQLGEEVAKRTDELHRAYEQLERLDRTKSDFIQVTAHELRTPLTVLFGYAQLLNVHPLLAGAADLLQLGAGIQSGTERMSEIVNTMLLMAKIDNRTLEIYAEPLDLAALLGNIAAGQAVTLAKRRLALTLDASLGELPPVEGDEEAIRTVFEKLVENAIKYTPDGGRIQIAGRSWSSAPTPGLPEKGVEITVTDSGIGIDPGQLELVFAKFYRTHDVLQHSSSKTQFKGGGPGLGLAIARGIIEAHYGKLWAESDGYDEKRLPGSCFHVALPWGGGGL